VAAISVGASHTCALSTAGGVKCWGKNGDGQLGDNTYTERYTPVDVSGLTSGVAAISVGGSHTCAVTTAGGVKCWGKNSDGQLGDYTITTRSAPVDVSGLTSGVAAISLGGSHTCALTTAGGVKCWGKNSDGQLGDYTVTTRSAPVDVAGFTGGVTAIAVGFGHTCAVTSAGGVKCWGKNSDGQLGDYSITTRSAPVDVAGLTGGVAVIAAGLGHTCVVTTAGGVKCWGKNSDGQLGDYTVTTRSAPIDVAGLTGGTAAIAAGFGHTCAVTTAGGVKCWGKNSDGQLGDSTYITRSAPVDVIGISAATSATATTTTTTASTTTTTLASRDTISPTLPTGLTANAVGATQINLSWTASTDAFGVTAYKVYRDAVLVTTLGNVTNYSDTGLTASTAYSYTLAACDAAGNCSAQSSSALGTTQQNVATGSNSKSDCLFNWAESSYGFMFLPKGTQSSSLGLYYFRYYSETKAYLAVAADSLFYLGPLSDNQAADLGSVSTWYAKADCN